MRDAYKSSGVDIDKANALIKRIRRLAKKTIRPEVVSSIGGFSGGFALDTKKYREPILISATDGVGTKIKVALQAADAGMQHVFQGLGIDLVAMNVNDILCQAAEPLFFLDYYATGKLQLERAEEVIKGVAQGCKQAGCALLGGETAEMPSFYPQGEFDIAGFVVGVVEKKHIPSPKNVQVGDKIIGIASSGIHSNGFSLVRKIFFKDHTLNLTVALPGYDKPLASLLLEPTSIYVKPVLSVLSEIHVKGMAHITGGGILENIPRALPAHLQACIQLESWDIPAIFSSLAELGKLNQQTLYRSFNMGIGFVLLCAAEQSKQVIELMKNQGYKSWVIGDIQKGSQGAILQG